MKELDKSKASSSKRAAFLQALRKHNKQPCSALPQRQGLSAGLHGTVLLPGWPSMFVNRMSELMVGYSSIQEDMEWSCPCSCSSSKKSYKTQRKQRLVVNCGTLPWLAAGTGPPANRGLVKREGKVTFYIVTSSITPSVPTAFPFHSTYFLLLPAAPAAFCVIQQTRYYHADNGGTTRALRDEPHGVSNHDTSRMEKQSPPT